MDEVRISLLAPVARERIESWVEEQVDRLRGQGRATGVWLGRLAPADPEQGGDWLVEVDLQARDVRLEDDVALAAILTDMELLGLRPHLLAATSKTTLLPQNRPPRTSASSLTPVAATSPSSVSSRPDRPARHA